MNNCFFIGKLIEDPQLCKVNNIDATFFKVAVEEYRKNKQGQKIKRVDTLDFEAWHTAAITITQNAKKHDMLAIEASARLNHDQGDCFVNFRINNFKIFDTDKYSNVE